MAGGGSRRDDGPLKIGSTNGFAVLDSLKKKKKSDKDSSKSKGSSKSHAKEAEPPVFWNPKPLVNKSWADVEDEDDDDYYATSAPPQGIWGSSERANQKKEIEAVIEEVYTRNLSFFVCEVIHYLHGWSNILFRLV